MTRIFIKDVIELHNAHCLTGDNAHYLLSVLRMRDGEQLDVVDGTGCVYHAFVSAAGKDQCIVTPVGRQEGTHEPNARIILYQSVSKGERMDLTIQKSVELGVHKIVPVISDRCVVKLDGKSGKSDRWQKIALEAARQSGRDIVPVVTEPVRFAQAVKNAGAGLKIIPWEEARGVTLHDVLTERGEAESVISVFIGPEGGFDQKELDYAIEHGCEIITLGKRILRTETAGMMLLSVLMYQLECLDI